MRIETYGGPLSFRLEDSFILSDVSHLPLINSLYEAYSLNWLSWEPVILDFLSEIFFTSVKDTISLYNISVRHQTYIKAWVVAPSSFE